MTRAERTLDALGRLLRSLRDGYHFIVREIRDELEFARLANAEWKAHAA